MSIEVIEKLEMLHHWPMYNSGSYIKHPRDVDAKIANMSKARAKRKTDFNDEELDVLVSCVRRNHHVKEGRMPEECQETTAGAVPGVLTEILT